jgi:hypothetical protein
VVLYRVGQAFERATVRPQTDPAGVSPGHLQTSGRSARSVLEERQSAPAVSCLPYHLSTAAEQFHRWRLAEEYRYLFLDGVELKVRDATKTMFRKLSSGNRFEKTVLRSRCCGPRFMWPGVTVVIERAFREVPRRTGKYSDGPGPFPGSPTWRAAAGLCPVNINHPSRS